MERILAQYHLLRRKIMKKLERDRYGSLLYVADIQVLWYTSLQHMAICLPGAKVRSWKFGGDSI
jgi:hypothetical protein